jgi:hypothetical protein
MSVHTRASASWRYLDGLDAKLQPIMLSLGDAIIISGG